MAKGKPTKPAAAVEGGAASRAAEPATTAVSEAAPSTDAAPALTRTGKRRRDAANAGATRDDAPPALTTASAGAAPDVIHTSSTTAPSSASTSAAAAGVAPIDPASTSDALPAPSDAPSSRKRARVIPSELRPEALAAFMDTERRKGVVYLSRIPPYMKPIALRHLLRDYGELGRLYLAPEDPVATRRRVESGGNKKQRWTEGWVEFMDKKEAKAAAAMLNTKPMGNNKRGFYGSDLWCIKYLKGFKWHHLTEKIAYEGRIHASKMRAEMSAARKEADTYIARAEASKAIRKREDWTTVEGDASAARDAGDGRDGLDIIRRTFVQRKPLHDPLLQPPVATPAAASGAPSGDAAAKPPRRKRGGA